MQKLIPYRITPNVVPGINKTHHRYNTMSENSRDVAWHAFLTSSERDEERPRKADTGSFANAKDRHDRLFPRDAARDAAKLFHKRTKVSMYEFAFYRDEICNACFCYFTRTTCASGGRNSIEMELKVE